VGVAAGEVRATGWGGPEAVSEITGLARSTIGRGLKDLDAAPLPKGRVRRKGGGRRHLSSRDTTTGCLAACAALRIAVGMFRALVGLAVRLPAVAERRQQSLHAAGADLVAISVDTKKKELIGNYKNGGTDYRPKGDPRRVKVHDFEDKEPARSCLMACTTLAPMQGG
jgi:Rhodopirellula transposase DDE domain